VLEQCGDWLLRGAYDPRTTSVLTVRGDGYDAPRAEELLESSFAHQRWQAGHFPTLAKELVGVGRSELFCSSGKVLGVHPDAEPLAERDDTERRLPEPFGVLNGCRQGGGRRKWDRFVRFRLGGVGSVVRPDEDGVAAARTEHLKEGGLRDRSHDLQSRGTLRVCAASGGPGVEKFGTGALREPLGTHAARVCGRGGPERRVGVFLVEDQYNQLSVWRVRRPHSRSGVRYGGWPQLYEVAAAGGWPASRVGDRHVDFGGGVGETSGRYKSERHRTAQRKE
jgi:hypothetical protein